MHVYNDRLKLKSRKNITIENLFGDFVVKTNYYYYWSKEPKNNQ